MFTLRIILVGLIAIVNGDNAPPSGETAILVSAQDHRPYIFLLEGECVSGAKACRTTEKIFTESWSSSLEWSVAELNVWIPGPLEPWLMPSAGRPLGKDEPRSMPTGPEQVADYTWLPQLSKTLGPNHNLKPDCLDPGTIGERPCPVAARFALPPGRIGTCHLAHEPILRLSSVDPDEACSALSARAGQVGASRVWEYEIAPGYDQAMGNVVVVETLIDENSVELLASDASQWPPPSQPTVLKATLKPSNGALTLVVMNEKIWKVEDPSDAKDYKEHLIARLSSFVDTSSTEVFEALGFTGVAAKRAQLHTTQSHFSEYYELFDNPSATGVPKLPPNAPRVWVSPGLCEPYLECLDSVFSWSRLLTLESATSDRPVLLAAPHSVSECDAASYP